MTDGIPTPRKPSTTHAASSRHLPFCLGGQAITISLPVDVRNNRTGAHYLSTYRITRSESGFFASGIAPLYGIPPVNLVHRMIKRLGFTWRKIRVTRTYRPKPHLVPKRLGSFPILQKKWTDCDIHRWSVSVGVTTGSPHDKSTPVDTHHIR